METGILSLLIIIIISSFGLTYLIKLLAKRFQIVDKPNQRTSHQGITPRGGGLAIVITWFLGISYVFYIGKIDSNLYFALMSGILLAVVSLLDDVISLSPKIRLFTQVLVAGLALYFLRGINPIQIHGFEFGVKCVLIPIVVIGMVWFINLYNFLDGIDAYVSIETIFLAVAFFFFTKNGILLVLITSVIGFLFWNWPKAKIFMGDVGSTQLGFILIVLGIYFHNSQELSILYWILLTAPFWFDATFTLFRRWRNKEKLSEAHKKHAYQRIVQAGFSHLKTDWYLVLINLFIFALVVFSKAYEFLYIPSFVLMLIILLIVTKRVDKRKSF